MWLAVLSMVAATTTAPTAATMTMSLAEAVLAADGAPMVAAARSSAEGLADAARRASLLDTVRFEVQPGGQFDPLAGAWVSPSGQLALEGTLSLAGVTGARRAVAAATAGVVAADSAAHRQDRRLAIVRAWFLRRAAEVDEAAVARAAADAVVVQTTVKRLAATNVVSADDIAEADAFVAEAGLLMLDAEAVRLEAGLHLGRLVGVDVEVATDSATDGAATLPPDALGSTRVDLAVAHAEEAVQQARATLHEHDLRQQPALGIGLAAQVDDPSAGFVYGRLSLTLPSLDGDVVGRAGIAWRLRTAEAELEEQRRLHQERLALVVHEVEHQQAARVLITERLLPALRERRRLAERRQALGDGVVFEVVRATRAENDAVRKHGQATVQEQLALTMLRLLSDSSTDASTDVIHHDAHDTHAATAIEGTP